MGPVSQRTSEDLASCSTAALTAGERMRGPTSSTTLVAAPSASLAAVTAASSDSGLVCGEASWKGTAASRWPKLGCVRLEMLQQTSM